MFSFDAELAFIENYMKIMFPRFEKKNVLVWLNNKDEARLDEYLMKKSRQSWIDE
jgi:hypothetical protein